MPTTKKKPTPKRKKLWRDVCDDHFAEISGLGIGTTIIICATVAAIFKVLDSNALAVILGGAAGGGIGYGAGRIK